MGFKTRALFGLLVMMPIVFVIVLFEALVRGYGRRFINWVEGE